MEANSPMYIYSDYVRDIDPSLAVVLTVSGQETRVRKPHVDTLASIGVSATAEEYSQYSRPLTAQIANMACRAASS